MALSGTFYDNVGSYWRIQGEWTATQNEGANTSTITLRTYWMATRSDLGAIYSSSSKSGSSVIEGTSESFSATAGLSNGQKKLINTQTRTITHNSDGTFPDLDLSVSFSPQVTLSGTYYGTVSASGSFPLNTIPRESTLSSSPSWTAGNNTTIAISRHSSSFRHEVDIYVRNSANTSWILIKQRDLTSSQTSISSSFSTAEVTEIFSVLAGRSSAATRMVVDTYSGSTFIGSTSKEGTVTAPAASHPTTGYDAYWYIDETLDIPITRANSAFTHTVRFKAGSFTKTVTGVGTNVSWNATTTEENSIYNQIPNDKYINGSIEVDTFYNGVQVRDTTVRFLQLLVRDADPVFNAAITYADTNTATTTITGNNQYIVQGKSNLKVTLSAASVTPQKGATMSGFLFMVAGESETVPYTSNAVTVDFGTINASTNQTIVVEAVDSRGNRSSISKIALVVPYSTPTITSSAARINGFEADTILKMSGSFNELKVAGVAKNYLTSVRYRTREKNGAWSGYTAFPYTNVAPNKFTGTDQTVIFDITKAYEVEFSAIDRLGTTTISKTVGVGRPIFFIDDVLGSIGVNDFPKDPGTFLLNGRLTFAGNLYNSGVEGAVGGAIDVNNGDIVGCNAFWFRDTANNSGEGLLFPRSDTVVGSTNVLDYDNFYIRDSTLYINNEDFMTFEYGGSSTGSSIALGAGGRTIVAAGESVITIAQSSGFAASSEYLLMGADENIYFYTNVQDGWSAKQEFRFDQNGYFYRPRYKEKNGFNAASIYSSSVHEELMLIQSFTGSVNIGTGNQAYADFTYPTSFDASPQWVIVAGRDSNSTNASFGAYTATSTGVRIYATRVNDSSSTAMAPNFQVIVCGRKA